MSKPLHVIYIPGFGGRYDAIRLRLLRRWQRHDMTVELVSMHWTQREGLEKKLDRVAQAIERAGDKRIVLIGESAGGSVVVHLYAKYPGAFYKVMTLCGKNTRPETVAARYYEKSPDFEESMKMLNDSLAQLSDAEQARFVSIHPLYDPVVPVKDTLLPGCQEIRLWSVGHLFVIFATLLFPGKVIRGLGRKP